MVEFVSYDGEYPCLCSGVLKIKIDGKEIALKNCLSSGGSVWFDDDCAEHIEEGEWTLDVPKKYEHLKQEITDVVNVNVPYGCCGGCI
jgi:hypothetical protein